MAVEVPAGSEVTAPPATPATACRGVCWDAVRTRQPLFSCRATLAGGDIGVVHAETS